MSHQEPAPQQVIRIFGQADQLAYERTISMREVTFTCRVCQQQCTELRYPGPLPRYCSEACRAVGLAALNQERVRKQRAKRREARAAKIQGATPVHLSPPTTPPLLLSRLAPPRLPTALVERARCLALLDASLAYKLTLLVAPAGFGKTTAVNQWITTRQESNACASIAWISLEECDNNLLGFWRAVMTACQLAQKEVGDAALQLLSQNVSTPFLASPIEQTLTLFLNDLGRQEKTRLLVLDDYQVITDARIHESVTFVLNHLPAGQHVILLSRTPPPLPLIQWRAKNESYEIHESDLRFSQAETAAFWRQAHPGPVSASMLQRLTASVQGWAAGLRLLLLALQGEKNAHDVEHALDTLLERPALSASQQALFRSFLDDILQAQPAEVQRFLLQTSILGRMTGALCDAITQGQASASLLATIEQAGLFLEPLDGGWYRYHALFMLALRTQACFHLGEAERRALALRASGWYEQHGMYEEAIETAFQAQETERVARLIEQAGDFYNPPTMLRWLEPLAAETLHAHPKLALIFAVELRFSQQVFPLPKALQERIEALLGLAEAEWHRQGSSLGLGMIWAFRALNALLQGPFSHAVHYAQQALTLLPDEDLDHSMLAWRCSCLFLLALRELQAGQLAQARVWLVDARTRSQVSSNHNLSLQICLQLGAICILQGELHLAAEYYRQVHVVAQAQGEHEAMAAALLGLAQCSFEWHDLATAEQQVGEALQHAPFSHYQAKALNDRATLQLILLDYVNGRTVSAQQQLAVLQARLEMTTAPVLSPLALSPLVLIWQIRTWLSLGHLERAAQSLERVCGEKEQGFPYGECLLVHMLQARLLLAQGQKEAAYLLLRRLLAEASTHLYQLYALEIMVLLALACEADNRRQEAYEWLHQALSRARAEGLVRVFLLEGETLTLLLRQLFLTLKDKTLRSYVHQVLTALLLLTGPSFGLGLLSQPLSPQEQRVLDLLVTGCTNQEIAQELVVSLNTVKDHLKHLYRKLGVSTRLQASQMAPFLNR